MEIKKPQEAIITTRKILRRRKNVKLSYNGNNEENNRKKYCQVWEEKVNHHSKNEPHE